jgi:small subunit ribosomal protein S6
MKRRYETVFIATPVLSEAQMKETVDKFRGILVEHGAEIKHEDYWGLRKLAYPIKGKSTGFYQLIEFEAETDVVNRLEVEYRRDERLIRFLSFKLDKHAIEYVEKRRSSKQVKEVKEEK